VGATGHLATEVEGGLWELVAAGLVTADGFDNLRALLDPRRRRAEGRERSRRPRHVAGRWSLLRLESQKVIKSESPGSGRESAPGHDDFQTLGPSDFAVRVARQLLRRYGIVFRD